MDMQTTFVRLGLESIPEATHPASDYPAIANWVMDAIRRPLVATVFRYRSPSGSIENMRGDPSGPFRRNFELGVAYHARKIFLDSHDALQYFQLVQAIRFPFLEYLYLGASHGRRGQALEITARELTGIVAAAPNLRVVKTRCAAIRGSEREIYELGRAFSRRRRNFKHICLVETQVDYAEEFVEQIMDVSTVELYDCGFSFDGVDYSRLVSTESSVKSLTINGGTASRLFKLAPTNWQPNHHLRELYITNAPLFIGVGRSICLMIGHCTALISFMAELRGNNDAIDILREAKRHPTLVELSLILLPAAQRNKADVVRGEAVKMLQENERIKKLFLQQYEPRTGGYINLVKLELATELTINQCGRNLPGQGRYHQDWISAILYCRNDSAALYHFIRQNPAMFCGAVAQNAVAARAGRPPAPKRHKPGPLLNH